MVEYNRKGLNELDYTEIGNRIRSLRESLCYKTIDGSISITKDGRKLSQEKLLQYMDENNLPHFGRNTLSDLENGKPEAFGAVNMAQWIALCNIFECSVGHLLGEYDCSRYEIQYVQDVTGLTEDAIWKLNRIKDDLKSAHSDIISLLIERNNAEYYLALLGEIISLRNKSVMTPDEDPSMTPEAYNNQFVKIDIDGQMLTVRKHTLTEGVFQTQLIQDLPTIAKEFKTKYGDTPEERNKTTIDITPHIEGLKTVIQSLIAHKIDKNQ